MTDPTTGLAGVIATQAAMKAATDVFNRVILPAAKEAGLLLQDHVIGWRMINRIAVARKLEAKLKENTIPEGHHAHPQIACAIIEKSSWIDDSEVQDLWAGLLSSSCTETGDDDSNLIFVNLLGQMTKLQARVMKFVCERAVKHFPPSGLIAANGFMISVQELLAISCETDIQRLDRELDHLRAMALLDGGLNIHNSTRAQIGPTTLGLHMYVRCAGSRQSAVEYFKSRQTKSETNRPATATS